MSLDFELVKIRGFKDVCYDGKKMRAVTEVIIFQTMTTGIPEVTAKNVEECFVRSEMLARVFGQPLVTKNGGHSSPSLADYRAHIGLSTNALGMSLTKFKKYLVNRLEADERRKLQLELQKAYSTSGKDRAGK